MLIDASTDNIAVSPGWTRAPSELVDQLAAFPTSLISDAQSRLGVLASEIGLVTAGLTVAGVVLPVATREGDNLAVHRALDEAAPGDVLVIDAQGFRGRAVFGDILGEAFVAAGVRGVVVDGAVRDSVALEHLGFACYARSVTPAGPYKNGPGEVGTPVACGGVVCSAGDVIIGDADGLVVVARARAGAVLEAVIAQARVEEQLRARIRQSAQRTAKSGVASAVDRAVYIR